MKISKRAIVAASLAVAAVVALSACSSGASTPKPATTKTVTFWGSWNSTQQVAQINKQVAAFNKDQSTYKVTYVPQGLVEQKLLTGEASGQVPDVALWDRSQTSLYVSKGALQSIDSLVAKDKVKLSQFYSQPTLEMTVKANCTGCPPWSMTVPSSTTRPSSTKRASPCPTRGPNSRMSHRR